MASRQARKTQGKGVCWYSGARGPPREAHAVRVALGATDPTRPGVSFPLTLHFPECVAGVYWHSLNKGRPVMPVQIRNTVRYAHVYISS